MTKDPIEHATEAYLVSLDLGEVTYEPNGTNTAPDFSLDGRIGIEATRLVDIIEKGGVRINLTEEEPRIWQSFKKAIESVRNSAVSGSYFVHVNYSFPLDRWKCSRQIASYLKNPTMAQAFPVFPQVVELCDGLELELLRSSIDLGIPFVHGGSNHKEGGGLVLADILKQSREAIDRKEKSIGPIEDKFDEWWLAVAGYLTDGIADAYIEEISSELKETGIWAKLVLINVIRPAESRIVDLQK